MGWDLPWPECACTCVCVCVCEGGCGCASESASSRSWSVGRCCDIRVRWADGLVVWRRKWDLM